MSINEEVVFGLLLPLSAFGLSFIALSQVAKKLLRYGGLYFFGNFSLFWIIYSDCGYHDFHFGNCESWPQFVSDFYSTPYLVNVVALVTVAPILLLLACWLEYRVRRRK